MGALTFTQLHESNPCLPPQPCLAPHPKREGAEEGQCGEQEGRSSPAQPSEAQPSWLHLQTASRRKEDLPHKERVWNQPADPHSWQTQERKWQEVGTKLVFIICGGRGNYRGCEAPPFAVKPHGNPSAPQSGVAPTWTCLTTHLMSWQGTSQSKEETLGAYHCREQSSGDWKDTQLHLDKGHAPLRTRCGESGRASIRHR